MSSNNDENKPVLRVNKKIGGTLMRSEIAKEFGLKGPKGDNQSNKGVGENTILSVESQMNSFPVYTKKDKEKRE